jgi:uncharacterized protein
LRRAEELGGTRLLGPITSPNGLLVGQLTDPEASLIAIADVA